MSKIWGPFPYKSGVQNHLFSTTSQRNGNVNGLYDLRNETRIVSKRHELWPTNGFKLDRHFYPPCINSAFCFIARLRRRRSANETQPNFAKRRMVNRANNLHAVEQLWSSLPGKNWANKFLHLFSSMTLTLNGEYLLNEKRHRQSGKGAGK